MSKQGINIKYVANRYEPRIIEPFFTVARLLFLSKQDISQNYTEYSNAKRKLLKNPLVSTAYRYITLIDYLIQIMVKVKISLMLGRSVICDRYIHDTVIDLALDLGYSGEKVGGMLKGVLLRLAPGPDLIFLLDAPEEIVYERKEDTVSLNYLKERREIYLNLGRRYEMTILDGSADIAELEHSIWDRVKGITNA